MRGKWRTGLVAAAILAIVAAGVGAQESPPARKAELAEGESGKVILPWDTFRELTKSEREVAKEPKLTIPWAEVQDILGIKVEGVAGAELELDWRQFKALLEWSVAQKKPKPEPVVLPADYMIASADYVGMLREEGAVFDLAMVIDVLKEQDWKRIPLLPATVALEKATLPAGCHLNVAEGNYELLTAGKGRMEVALKFAAAVKEQAGAYQVGFNTMPSATTVLKLTVPSKQVTVDVAGAQAVLPLEAGASETVVGASLPSGAPVRITWERALEAVEKVPAKLYAETATLAAVGEGILTCREQVSLSVLHTGIRSVTLSLPDGVSVLEVTGQAVHDWRVADGILDVRFEHDMLGNTGLSLTYERAGVEAAAEVPVLRVPDAVREKGYIGIVALANVEISAPEHPGATSIDVRELPAEILRMTGQPVLLAFRYVGKELRIPLVVRKHEDVSVLLTIADSAVLTVMQTMDGRRITKAIYNVRNNRNQFIRLTLPKPEAGAGRAEVWSATVAGRSIRPALDEDGRVLIPLVRSSSAQAELASFPVELVYVEKQEGVAASGQMRVDLPRVDVPLTHLMVQLYLPAEGSYKKGILGGLSFEGPLRKVEEFSRISSAGPPPAEQVQADVQAQALQEQFTQRVEGEAVAAGVTPIRVQLPIRGQMFRFEKILVLDEPLWIAFSYSGWEKD